MARTETRVLRATLLDQPKIRRDIEVDAKTSLYNLAQAVVGAFGFDFDHAFGFYSGLNPRTMMDAEPRYELFADMGESNGARSVKRTAVHEAFPAVGHAMLMLFDYGDDWLFRVEVKEIGTRKPRVRYPKLLAAVGDAPPQYPDEEYEDEDE